MLLVSRTAETSMEDRFLYAGLIRLHVLHHAVEEPVYGLAMIEELGRHGYRLSAGTLYPILHGLEEKGYLRSVERRIGKTMRRVYRATMPSSSMILDRKSKSLSRYCTQYLRGL